MGYRNFKNQEIWLFKENFMGVEKKEIEKNHGIVEKVIVRKQRHV